MRSGEIVIVDFGVPLGSEAGFRRPAIVLTADPLLEAEPRTVQVVPVTSNTRRGYVSEVPLDDVLLPERSVAQVHLLTTISVTRIVESTSVVVSVTELAQIRMLVADLLDLPV